MRRLLDTCALPAHAALALAAIIANSMLQLAQPYLMKLAIDRYIPAAISRRQPHRARGTADPARRSARVHPDLAAADDRAADHVRHAHGDLPHLQRLDLRFYDRNPVGRLMTRVTTDVDVINDMFTSGVSRSSATSSRSPAS
jgi:ATP-binding cassette subfamily B protein